jgi:hypothetical protein
LGALGFLAELLGQVLVLLVVDRRGRVLGPAADTLGLEPEPKAAYIAE